MIDHAAALDSFSAFPLGYENPVQSGGEKLEAISAIVRAINARSAPQEIVDVLAEQLKPFIRFDSLFISRLQGETIEVVAFSRPDHGFVPITRETHPAHPLWAIIEKGWMWSGTNPCGPSDISKVGSFINVPLRVDERNVGVLHLDAFEAHVWTPDELYFARIVGEIVGAVVERAELLRQRDEREQAHAESLAILSAIQEATSEGICLVSGQGELLSYNSRFANLWKLDDSEALHREGGTVMSHVLEQLADPDEFLIKISALWEQPDARAQDEVTLRDGRVFERYSAPAIAPATEGVPAHQIGRIWTFSDITARKRNERQLAQQAFYDVVTGLPNRVLFAERLNRALKNLSRSRRHIAVLFLDLDRFKVINDSLGHDTGDHLLVQVATRLNDSIRPNDIAARFGGDEFVVLLEDIISPDAAITVAERIVTALNLPFVLAGHTVSVSASIGIVIGSDADESPDDILRKADVAMYRAKHDGKARHQLFSESISHATLDEFQLELDLAVALEKGEIEVFYQPLIDLGKGRAGAFEALARWRHSKRGLVPSAEFIRIAEESGMIVTIGERVLLEACRQAKKWSDDLKQPISMHVNVSARQIDSARMATQIAHALRDSTLPASQLVIEITESVLMRDAQSAIIQLEKLKRTGVRLSIDEFGTGYSSLAYLELFPLDLLKIDRAFIERMSRSQTLVHAVINLGRALGLEIVAEGIETRAQLETIQRLNVRWAQGFLFSRALSATEAEALLREEVDKMVV